MIGESSLTDILNLGMFHNILVHSDRSDPEQDPGEDHGNDTGDPAKDSIRGHSALISTVSFEPGLLDIRLDLRERPGLRHDSQADLITSQQNGSLLPRHGPQLDFMLMV